MMVNFQDMPRVEAMRKQVQRRRAAENPGNVALGDLVINGQWAENFNSDPFMIRDNNDAHDRVIVFSSPQCLDKLSQGQAWFCDGNFRMSPRIFMQVRHNYHYLLGYNYLCQTTNQNFNAIDWQQQYL